MIARQSDTLKLTGNSDFKVGIRHGLLAGALQDGSSQGNDVLSIKHGDDARTVVADPARQGGIIAGLEAAFDTDLDDEVTMNCLQDARCIYDVEFWGQIMWMCARYTDEERIPGLGKLTVVIRGDSGTPTGKYMSGLVCIRHLPAANK